MVEALGPSNYWEARLQSAENSNIQGIYSTDSIVDPTMFLAALKNVVFPHDNPAYKDDQIRLIKISKVGRPLGAYIPGQIFRQGPQACRPEHPQSGRILATKSFVKINLGLPVTHGIKSASYIFDHPLELVNIHTTSLVRQRYNAVSLWESFEHRYRRVSEMAYCKQLEIPLESDEGVWLTSNLSPDKLGHYSLKGAVRVKYGSYKWSRLSLWATILQLKMPSGLLIHMLDSPRAEVTDENGLPQSGAQLEWLQQDRQGIYQEELATPGLSNPQDRASFYIESLTTNSQDLYQECLENEAEGAAWEAGPPQLWGTILGYVAPIVLQKVADFVASKLIPPGTGPGISPGTGPGISPGTGPGISPANGFEPPGGFLEDIASIAVPKAIDVLAEKFFPDRSDVQDATFNFLKEQLTSAVIKLAKPSDSLGPGSANIQQAILSTPGQGVTSKIVDQGQSGTCVRAAVAVAITETSNRLSRVDLGFDVNSVFDVLVNISGHIDGMWPMQLNNYPAFQGGLLLRGKDSLNQKIYYQVMAEVRQASQRDIIRQNYQLPTQYVFTVRLATNGIHGLHAMVLTGFNPQSQQWVLQNSWGDITPSMSFAVGSPQIIRVDQVYIKDIYQLKIGGNKIKIQLHRNQAPGSGFHSNINQCCRVNIDANVMEQERGPLYAIIMPDGKLGSFDGTVLFNSVGSEGLLPGNSAGSEGLLPGNNAGSEGLLPGNSTGQLIQGNQQNVPVPTDLLESIKVRWSQLKQQLRTACDEDDLSKLQVLKPQVDRLMLDLGTLMKASKESIQFFAALQPTVTYLQEVRLDLTRGGRKIVSEICFSLVNNPVQ